MGRTGKVKLSDEDKKTISENLNKALEMSDFKTQKELAKKTGISEASMSRMFANGDTNAFTLPNLVAVAKELNVSMDYLLGFPNNSAYATEIIMLGQELDTELQTLNKLFRLSEELQWTIRHSRTR